MFQVEHLLVSMRTEGENTCVKASCQAETNIVDFWMGIKNLRQSLTETLLGGDIQKETGT